MESFVALNYEVKSSRYALSVTAVIGVAVLVTTLAWYGQRALCLVLPFIGECREFPQYFVLLLVLFVAQALMLACAIAASLGTNLPFIKATLGTAVTAALLDLIAVIVAVTVVGTNNYLAFTIALSLALAVAVAVVVLSASLLYQTTRWYFKATRALNKVLQSKFKAEELGRIPRVMLRAQRRLITLAEVDLVLVVLLLIGLIGFTIIPNSWRVVRTEVFFIILLFSGVHVTLWVFYRAVASLPEVYEQLQDTVMLPMSDNLIVFTIIATAIDALLVIASILLVVLELVLYDGPSAPVPIYWAMTLGILLALFLLIDGLAIQALTVFRAGAERWKQRVWTTYRSELGKAVNPETQLIELREKEKVKMM